MPLLPNHRRKLNRADEHLNALDQALKTFIEGKPYSTITEKEPQSGDSLVKLVSQRSPPRGPSTLIGDILFNLRSSLDHLVYALAVLNGATDEQKEASEFPVFSDRVKFADLAPKKIGGLTPEAWTAIERAQPYYAPDPDRHPIRLLHDLNRIDKHRLLHIVQTARLTGCRMVAPIPNPGSSLVAGTESPVGLAEIS